MITNTRNNLTLANQVRLTTHLWGRLRGLMCKKKLEDGKALFIYPCQQIHTFFMKFPIDCIFIDQEYRVIELIERFEPWNYSKRVPKALGVIELPKGVINRTEDRKSTRLNSSHVSISYAVFCVKKTN